MRTHQDYFDEVGGIIGDKIKPSRPSRSGNGTTIIIEGDNHGTINIGPSKDQVEEGLQESDKEESALNRASKLQLTDALHELRQLTTTLRELVTQLRRLGASSAWARQVKHLVSKVGATIANHLSQGPILASSICRAIFPDPSPPYPQVIDPAANPAISLSIPLNPAYLRPFVAAHLSVTMTAHIMLGH